MQENKQHIVVEHLRETLLKDIKLQEEVRSLFKRILKRTTAIYISIAGLLLIGIVFIIYVISRPLSKTGEALKQANEITNMLSIQRKFIEIDRYDIDKNARQVAENKRLLDSLRQSQDSIHKLIIIYHKKHKQ